jgi:hypothetical protein
MCLAAAACLGQDATRTPPRNEVVDATLDEVAGWPEYEKAETTVPRLEGNGKRFPPSPGKAPKIVRIPPRYGMELLRPAFMLTRDLVFVIAPEADPDLDKWLPHGPIPAEVTDEFHTSLLPKTQTTTRTQLGFPRIGVRFQVRDSKPVPVSVQLIGRLGGDWVPDRKDRKAWTDYATAIYSKVFGAPPRGELLVRWAGGTETELIWFDRWRGIGLPGKFAASVKIRDSADKNTWDFFLERGLDADASAALMKGLDSLDFKVTPREAMAIAAKNWKAALPTKAQQVGMKGAFFELGPAGPFVYRGGINRETYYFDPDATDRLQSGELLFGVWSVYLSGPGWDDRVRVLVAADTGRVVQFYGPQGLDR